VLPPGDKGNITTKGTSYGTYDISKILPPGEYYKRKPQSAATGGENY